MLRLCYQDHYYCAFLKRVHFAVSDWMEQTIIDHNNNNCTKNGMKIDSVDFRAYTPDDLCQKSEIIR